MIICSTVQSRSQPSNFLRRMLNENEDSEKHLALTNKLQIEKQINNRCAEFTRKWGVSLSLF